MEKKVDRKDGHEGDQFAERQGVVGGGGNTTVERRWQQGMSIRGGVCPPKRVVKKIWEKTSTA